MATIDGEFKRISRKAKRKKQAQNLDGFTSIGSEIYDWTHPDQYKADSSDAPTQDQINAVKAENAILDNISATVESVVNSLGSYGKLILIGAIVFFIATR